MWLVGWLVFLLASVACLSQSIGIKLGATFPQWKYVADSAAYLSTSKLSNFTIALVQELPLGKLFSVQFEPTYSLRTTQTNIAKEILSQYSQDTLPSTLPPTLQFEHDITSVELPLFLRVTIDPGIWIRPYFMAGPNIRIQLSTISRLKTDTTDLGTSIPLDVRLKARATIASVDLAGGVELPLGILSIVADARYMFLLTEMSSLSAFGQRLGSLNSNDLRIFAGIMFRW